MKDATTDPTIIKQCWGRDPEPNIGGAMGNGIVAIDEDTPGALLALGIDLPNGPAQRTGRGVHLLFKANGHAIPNRVKFAAGLDTRSDDGYILLPPSMHETGCRYRWVDGHSLNDLEIPDIPAALAELACRNGKANGKADGTDLFGRTQIEELLQQLEAGTGPWRVPMLRIVGSMMARRTPVDVILAVCRRATWTGYTHKDTDKWVMECIRSTRERWGTPEPDEDTFDKVDGEQQEAVQDRLRLVPPSEMDWRGAQLNLVKGLLGFGMMALLYGESGSAKTLIALSLALHVALGRDWCGRKVRQGFVAYIAPEGGHSVHLRCHAWCKHHGITMSDAIPFRTIPVTVDLCSSAADLTGIIANIRAAEGELGPCVLAAIDTVSRALAGGDENSSEAMGRFVVNCDRLREEIGATVLGVHHTPRGGSTPRGHSSLQNGAEIRLHARKVAAGLFALTLEHLKDGEAGEELMFSLHSAVVGKNDDGEEVSGGLVTKAGITAAGAPGNPHGKLTDRQLRVLQEMSKQAAATKRWEFTTEEFNEVCIRSGAVDHTKADNIQRARCSDLRMQLANRGHISVAGDIIRLVISPCV